MSKLRKSFSVLMVLALALSLAMVGVLRVATEPVNAADFHVATAIELHAALLASEDNGEHDVIWVDAGVYVGNFQYTARDGMALLITGEPGTTAADIFLDGGGAGAVLDLDCVFSGSSVTIEDVTLQNGGAGGLWVEFENAIFDVYLNRVVIEGNITQGNGSGIRLRPRENSVLCVDIRNCIIRYNETLSRSGGIHAHTFGGNSTIDLFIINTLIYGNEAFGTSGGIQVSASEVGDDNVTRAVIINSTITGNVSDSDDSGDEPGGGIWAYAYHGNGSIVSLDLYNTIVYDNVSVGGEPGQDLYIGELNPGQTTVNAFHSDIGDVATEPGINYSTVNVINADPLFVNPLVDNYHLDNGSPCIDTGTTVVPIPPGLPTTDLDGNPRIWGAEPDIGVYEWIGNAIVWDCPLSLVALISPYPANDRPFLATAVDLSQVIYESTWFQVYYLDEATGTVFWYDSILESGTLVWLQPWDYYYVVVSNPCDLYIPQ